MRRALILDTETTGLDESARVIEVAAIGFDLMLGCATSSFSTLLRSDSNESEGVNGIPVAALVEAPEPADVWAHIARRAANSDVILAHNADFDRRMVQRSCPEQGPLSALLGRPWCCTMRHVDWLHGKRGMSLVNRGMSLVNLVLAHGLGVATAHRAMADCEMIARLLSWTHARGALDSVMARAMRQRKRYVAHVSYDDRQLAKDAGFEWEPKTKRWIGELAEDEIGSYGFEVELY
jgi:DNA polymerase-3 subunit epsilon